MSFEQIIKNVSFDFPFKPYEIQLDFAKNLYFALSTKKFTILESPTGTVTPFLFLFYFS